MLQLLLLHSVRLARVDRKLALLLLNAPKAETQDCDVSSKLRNEETSKETNDHQESRDQRGGGGED